MAAGILAGVPHPGGCPTVPGHPSGPSGAPHYRGSPAVPLSIPSPGVLAHVASPGVLCPLAGCPRVLPATFCPGVRSSADTPRVPWPWGGQGTFPHTTLEVPAPGGYSEAPPQPPTGPTALSAGFLTSPGVQGWRGRTHLVLASEAPRVPGQGEDRPSPCGATVLCHGPPALA